MGLPGAADDQTYNLGRRGPLHSVLPSGPKGEPAMSRAVRSNATVGRLLPNPPQPRLLEASLGLDHGVVKSSKLSQHSLKCNSAHAPRAHSVLLSLLASPSPSTPLCCRHTRPCVHSCKLAKYSLNLLIKVVPSPT